MGRKAKPEKFSELYAMYSKELDHAKDKLENIVKNRAIQIGMVAIKAGAGDLPLNVISNALSKLASKTPVGQ